MRRSLDRLDETSPTSKISAAIFLALLACGPAGAQEDGTAVDPVADILGAATFRHVGPVGNRVSSVVGVAGEPNLYFAGAASGGVWKSTDGGHTWRPTFDETGAASIGALAVARSDVNVVWAGTGEAFLRANISIGNGVYRSTDGGESWQHRGLEKTGRIARIVVDPRNPDVVFVAALGHVYGPQKERGIFRTRDGGETWDHVLFSDENAGASDLVMDPNNPRILYAGLWQIEIRTHSRTSGGPGSGLWKTKDGGDTWDRLEENGLPDAPWGKVALTMSADDSRRVYALIETSSNRDFAPSDPYQGTLWRSDDAGGSWEMVNADNTLHQRPLYYSRMQAAPDDADEVHFVAVDQTVSKDGGKSVEVNNSGWDHHDIWIDPTDTDRRITGHDGGVSVTTDGGENWYRPQLPIAQMYHVATDRQVPYKVYGNRQDGFAVRGPSRVPGQDEIPLGSWQTVGGCEVGFTVPDPENPELIWAGCYDGLLSLFDGTTGMARDVSVWPEAVESWAGENLGYRFHWTFPLEISPHGPETVYVGSQFVHRTTNRGQSWKRISPDLTTDDPELKRRTGGLTLDDAGPTLGPSIFALAESPRMAGELWVGTNDGQVQRSRDGGETWTNLTANLPDAPELGTVSNIEPSRHRDGVVYLTIDAHQEGDTKPHVYRTEDHGESWTKIVEGVVSENTEESVFSYAHCVREDPEQPGLLYLGTENGLYLSLDDGDVWQKADSGLPPAPVHWIEVQEDFGDLVLATYGRGIQILDDLSALRAAVAEKVDLSSSALFPPRPVYRFRGKEGILAQPDVPAAGTNPPRGAILHFYLSAEQEDSPEIDIVDAEGEVVRTLGQEEDDELPKKAGVHRVTWDLSSDQSTEVRLRTKPDENPNIEIPDEGWRELSDGEPVGLLAMPGTYTVRLRLGDQVVAERPLEVRKDPTSGGSLESLAEQGKYTEELWRMADESARMINEIEWMRLRIDQLQERYADDEPDVEPEVATNEMLEKAEKVDEQLRSLEGRFFDLRLTGARQDTLRWQRRLYSRLGYLAWLIGSSDEHPTASQVAVFAALKHRFAAAEGEWDSLRSGSVAELDRLIASSGLGGLVAATSGG